MAPYPPPSVKTATRRPSARRPLTRVTRTSTISAGACTRMMSPATHAASTTRVGLVSDPVCDAAPRAAAAERPGASSTTGFPAARSSRAAERAAVAHVLGVGRTALVPRGRRSEQRSASETSDWLPGETKRETRTAGVQQRVDVGATLPLCGSTATVPAWKVSGAAATDAWCRRRRGSSGRQRWWRRGHGGRSRPRARALVGRLDKPAVIATIARARPQRVVDGVEQPATGTQITRSTGRRPRAARSAPAGPARCRPCGSPGAPCGRRRARGCLASM
jgi:hypothetical protein